MTHETFALGATTVSVLAATPAATVLEVRLAQAPARALFFCSPGGLERFFREVAAADTAEEAAAAAMRAGLLLD